MSILDDIKEKVTGLLGGHGDKATESLDTVHGLAEEKTGDITEQVEGGIAQAKDAPGNVEGKIDSSI